MLTTRTLLLETVDISGRHSLERKLEKLNTQRRKVNEMEKNTISQPHAFGGIIWREISKRDFKVSNAADNNKWLEVLEIYDRRRLEVIRSIGIAKKV